MKHRWQVHSILRICKIHRSIPSFAPAFANASAGKQGFGGLSATYLSTAKAVVFAKVDKKIAAKKVHIDPSSAADVDWKLQSIFRLYYLNLLGDFIRLSLTVA